MDYLDITQTGGNDYRTLQKQNNSQFIPSTELQGFLNVFNTDISTNSLNPSELVTIGNSLADPIPFGTSKYDRNPTSLADYTERNDRRAFNLPTVLKWASGIGKFLTTAGSIFLSSTLGTVVGIGEGAVNAIQANEDEKWKAFWHGFSNNQVTKTMVEFNKEMENVLVNYYSDYEQQLPWWLKLGTANFWADGIIKNAGFTVGSVAAAMAWGMIIPGLSVTAAASGGVKGIAAGFAKMALGSIGEANIESVHVVDELQNQELNLYKTIKQYELAKLQQEFYNDLGTMSLEQAQVKYLQGVTNLELDLANMISSPTTLNSIIEAGNNTFALNFALLTLTNYLQVSNFIRGGKTMAEQIAKGIIKAVDKNTGKEITGQAISNAFKNKTLNYAGELLDKPALAFAGKALATGVSEGILEEGGQGLISAAEKVNAISKWQHTPIGSYFANDLYGDVTDRAGAYAKAFQQQYGSIDSQGWQEVAMGFIGGVLGAPFFGRKQNLDGSFSYGFLWIGGLNEAYTSTYSQNAEVKKFLTTLNSLINDPKFVNKFYTAVGMMLSEQDALEAIKKGNVDVYKQEEFRAIAEQVNLFTSLGRIDDLMAIYEGFANNFAEEDIPMLKEATGLDLSAYTNEEIVNQFKDKAKTTLDKIEIYRNSMKTVLEFMNTPEFLTEFAEYLQDPVSRNIIQSHLAFGDANIAELKRRRDKVQSKLHSLDIDDDAIEISQLNKDLADINQLLDNANTLEYKKKHLTETKKEFDKLFDYINKAAVGNKVDSAIQSLSQATTLAEVAENFLYLNPEIRDTVVNGVKNAASPELKELIEKYENFDRIQKIIQSLLKDLANKYSYLGEDNVSALLLILELEFGKAVTQTLMSEAGDLSATSLKDILDEILYNDYLDNADVNNTTKTYVGLLRYKLQDTIDTAYSIPTPTPVATGTGTNTTSTGCKYENVDTITDPDVLEMLEETAFQNLLNLNKHELYDRYFNSLFVTDEDKVLFDKALDACKTYFEKHPDATIKDATIALLRDVFTKADIADFQKAAFIAQVVFNKVEAHPVAEIPTPSAPQPKPAAAPATSNEAIQLSPENKEWFINLVNNSTTAFLEMYSNFLLPLINKNTPHVEYEAHPRIISKLIELDIISDIPDSNNPDLHTFLVLNDVLLQQVIHIFNNELSIRLMQLISLPIQAPQTTTTNPQTSTSQEPKPQQPVQPTSPKQPVFMFGETQAYYEWAAQGIEKHNDWGLPKWLMEHGYNLDLMRTKYLRHITPETPIHFIYHKDVANITGLSKVALTPIFLAIDVESLPEGVFNEPTSNKMVVESNGKRYILLGTYGGVKTASAGQEQLKSAQDVHWRNMLNDLLREANNNSNKVIVSPHTTTILAKDGITYGNVVIAERDKDGVDHYHKSEVIQMLGNPELNPLGFTKNNLLFYVNYGVSKHISDGVSIDDIIGGNDLVEGQVYMLLPATTLGKYIPFKINTVTFKEKETEVEANSKFKNRLLNALSGLVDTELANSQNEELINKTLNAAKQEVFKYLNFKEIAYLGYSKPAPGKTIKINLYGESGGAITTLLDLGTVTQENKLEKIQELYNAILALDVLHSPLINIEGAWISDPNENAMYFGEDTVNGIDSLLTTDTNMLAVLHSNFFVHAVDENGNMITQGFSKSTTSKQQQEEKLEMKVYNIAGENYRYFPSTKTITTESGLSVKADDPTYIYLNAILNNTPFTITIGNTTQTYIPCGTTLLRYANKAYTLVTDEKEVSKILTQKNQLVLAKSVEEKATKILEKIENAEEQLGVVVGEMIVDKIEEPVAPTKPITTTKHLNVNVETIMALTGFTEEEVIQRITVNDKAQHQGLYVMANDELAIHLTQRIAVLAKLNRLLRRGFPKGIITQVPLVNDALQSLIDFCKNTINKDLLIQLNLQDTKPIDILRMLVAKHPLRDYNQHYDNDKLINDLNELVNCK